MDDRQTATGADADLYTHHLYLSHFGREWAGAVLRESTRESGCEAEYLKGYAQALLDVADHLEAGEGLPGGPLYRHVTRRFAAGGPRV